MIWAVVLLIGASLVLGRGVETWHVHRWIALVERCRVCLPWRELISSMVQHPHGILVARYLDGVNLLADFRKCLLPTILLFLYRFLLLFNQV